MADAIALFRRHNEQLTKLLNINSLNIENAVKIYGACIIAEAIRNSLED